jgi:hypothetical protein
MRTALRFGNVAMLWEKLLECLINPYRPEHHYMRGPGPKWHHKRRDPLGPIGQLD